uniref:G_PROTEIN_RECEP_F1_2 domain-containing protein n=1 Tax=Steinernema glaseri TaxID=37863 RepID=A0A1I7ZXF0_9BILA
MSHVGVGILIAIGENPESALSKALGGVLHLAWFGIIFLNLLLSLERVNVTVCSSTIRVTRSMFVAISAATWLPGVMYFIVDQTSQLTFYVNTDMAKWDYLGTNVDMWIQIAIFLTFIPLPMTFLVYVIIYIHLVKQRGKICTQSSSSLLEKSVLYSSTLMFLYPCGEEIIFFVLRFMDTTAFTAFFVDFTTHIMWISLPIFCQIVQLIFNKSIRRNFKRLCMGKAGTITIGTLPSNSNSTRRTNQATKNVNR